MHTPRLMLAFCAALPLAAHAQVVAPPRSPESSETMEAPVAEALIRQFAATTGPEDLTRLYSFQIAAGHFEDAERSIERLQTAYQPKQPQMANALVPMRIFVRAKRGEARGMTASAALSQAFDEL